MSLGAAADVEVLGTQAEQMGTPQTLISLPSLSWNPAFKATESQKVPRGKEHPSVPRQAGSVRRQATNI